MRESPQDRRVSELVLIAGKNPCTQTGGHASYVRAHARAATALGFTPHIFYVGPRNNISECEFGVLHEVASPGRPFRPIMLIVHLPRLVAAIESFLQVSPGPHLIHTFGFWLGVAIRVRRNLVSRGSKVVVVASAYSTFRHEYAAKIRGAFRGVSYVAMASQSIEFVLAQYLSARYEGADLRESDAVLVNYESVSRIIASEFGGNIECRRIAYCSEAAFLPRAPDPTGIKWDHFRHPEAPMIVAVSRHDPRKGIVYLLEALAALRESESPFRACLVGGGALLEPHRRLAKKLGLEGWVQIEGWVADSIAYLNQADIFVLPSTEEGSGSVALLEALQAGLPIVASNIDGIPEDVSESEAILVEAGSSLAIADALKTLLRDPGLRARMGRSARERYETHFSAEAFIASLGGLYSEFGFRANS